MLRLRLLALLLVPLLVVTACSPGGRGAPSPGPEQAEVQVSGEAGQPPVLDYPRPFSITQPGSRLVWPGTGLALEDGGPVLLNLYAEDGRDGSVVQSTYLDAPAWYTMSVASLGRHLYDALSGQRVGARLLFLEEDQGVPLVLVVDVLPTRASGDEVTPAEGLPQVERDSAGRPHVRVPRDTPPPDDLVVQPLVRGTGSQVEVGEVVTVRFTGVRWSDGEVFDTTWDSDDTPEAVQAVMIGIGQVVEGWDQGLLEQTVGSQVMLVVPPSLGYGGTSSPLQEETLVYVVDILDAHFQVTEENQGEEEG
ncbi:FKBP-type peptidyl-prolyl cis-trans isomerase [Xylanimonas oleitrophica]|uniref:Peptidyl-prolyl cis-trans isomerase n=1 Tax=Xylanimonas oleitrophica TaxID=2607479 RepID=A0A2W5WLQ9_9MICO|nr:FKBP-type peptidyl-prolyl cis-trans isomerase [Xylanimonas oleitrophica]PZR52479.1 FKBP-type peptidyl-prolyl cis-trans isomerase [Xylanimonas oleitrophica]